MNVASHFVSRRATVDPGAYLTPPLVILGPTEVGPGSTLFSFTLLGFPVRRKLLEALGSSRLTLERLDELSSGSRLGARVIVRSHCVIYEDVELGDGVELGHGVLVREGTVIGRGARIGSGTVIDGRAVIGAEANVQSGVYIPPGTRIGSRVFVGPRAVVTNDKYPPSRRIVETVVEDDAVVGANSTIVAGVRIGRGAVVAAGAVVTKDVEPETVVAGVPARPIMTRREYEERKRLYEEGAERGRPGTV